MGPQPERAPINVYYGRQLARISNEAGEVIMLPEGSEGSYNRMRNFVEMVRRRCQQMPTKMNCTVAGDAVQPASARSGSSCAASSRATTSTLVERDGDKEEEDDDVDAKLPDEMVLSNLVVAPTPTQPTQAMPSCRKRHDRTDIS